MNFSYFFFIIILLAGVFTSIYFNKLTLTGGIAGGLLSIFIFMGMGFTGIALLASFFIMGTLATSWRKKEKIIPGIVERESSQRTFGQVMANGGVAGLMGLLCWIFPDQKYLFGLTVAASLASATADTLSSELGTVYGKRFYNILGFRPGTRGENGVVSIEGTLFGLAGSILIAVIAGLGWGWSVHLVFVVVGGTAGNFVDSVLGATLERKRLITNDAVNLFNTIFAAVITFILLKTL